MSLVSYRPALRLQREINRMLGDWPNRDIEWHPSIDIHETEEAFVVTAELPGVKREDVKMHLENNVLTISGEKKQEEQKEGHGYYRIERAYGSFERAFKLPSIVDADGISAAYKNGILTVTLPKAEAARPKEIPIAGS